MNKDFRIMASRFIIMALCIIASVSTLKAQWVQTGRPGAGLTLVLNDNVTDVIAGTFGGGVYLSTDGGANWNARNDSLTNLNVFALAVDGTNVYLGTGDGVRFSNNKGASWTTLNNGLTSTFVVSLAIVSNGTGSSNFFAGMNGGGVCFSTNNGVNWTAVNNGLPNLFVHVLIATSDTSGTTLFAGIDIGGVFVSTNNGANWNPANTGLPNASIFALVDNGTNVFAGMDGGRVFRSSNNGSNWTRADSGLSGTSVSMLTFRPNGTGTILFAAMSSGGVFYSTNDGTSWTAINTGLTNTDIRALSFFPASGPGTNIFSANFNGDIWKRPISEIVTSVESPETDLPAHFKLEQNYPNPFNPTSTIRFDLPSTSKVSLRVYDILGRLVATLLDGVGEAGNKSIAWNASNVASGVFFYRLEASSIADPSKSFTQVKKMLLVR